eukprot:m.24837 g.24837  ORF g.24837 m.24837 type:complete len:408 (-) comp6124_c0_seq1:334-1557(-)
MASAGEPSAPLRTPLPSGLDPRPLALWVGSTAAADRTQYSISDILQMDAPLEDGKDRSEHIRSIGLKDSNFELRTVIGRCLSVLETEWEGWVVQVRSPLATSTLLLRVRAAIKQLPHKVIHWKDRLDALPLLEVDWCLIEVGTAAGPVEYLRTNTVGDVEVKTTDAAVGLLRDLLLKNRKRLNPEYVTQAEEGHPVGVHCSVLTPIEAAVSNENRCGACGKYPRTPKWCGGCRKVAYCDVQCQTHHWKVGGHKAECVNKKKKKAGGTEGAGKLLQVDVSKLSGFMAAVHTTEDSITELVPIHGSSHAVTTSAQNKGETFPPKARGTEVVVKVQVQPFMDYLLIYDRTRAWQIYADQVNCLSGCKEISHLIRTRGIQGSKGYFRAWIPKEDKGVLKINFDEFLPARNW